MNIWSDNWIPSLSGFKSLTLNMVLSPKAKVSSFINVDLGCWRVDVLKEVFGESEAAHIVGIPLSSELCEDKLVWNAEKDGEFSVKYVYHHLVSIIRISSHGLSSSVDASFQKLLWKAHVSSRIKEFLWRLVKNILPTRSSVCKKGFSIDSYFPFFHCCPESSSLLFLHCDFIKRMFFSPPGCEDLGGWRGVAG